MGTLAVDRILLANKRGTTLWHWVLNISELNKETSHIVEFPRPKPALHGKQVELSASRAIGKCSVFSFSLGFRNVDSTAILPVSCFDS